MLELVIKLSFSNNCHLSSDSLQNVHLKFLDWCCDTNSAISNYK